MRKTLVVKLGALGDVLRVTPVIHSLHDNGHAIEVVTSDVGAQVLRNNPYVKNVYKIRHKRNPFELFFLKRHLQKMGYDTVVNFESQKNIGSIFQKLNSRKYLNCCSSEPEKRNVNLVFYGVVRDLLKPGATRFPNELFPTEDDREDVKVFLEGAAAPTGKVGIHVGTSKTNRLFSKNFHDVRLWPAERYIELIQRLVENRYTVFLTGSRLEKTVNQAIVKSVGHGQVLDTSGMFNIQQLQVLIAQMDWFVSGDTGPAHVAASVPVRQICMCGPTDAHSAPWKATNLYRIQKNSDGCPPCYATDKDRKSSCRENACMTNISVEDVLKIILISNSQKAASLEDHGVI